MKILQVGLDFLQKALLKIRTWGNRLGRLPYVRDLRVRVAAGAVILLIVFWALPTFAANAPNQIGYGIKRFEESLASNLAPTSGWRQKLRLDFAVRRVDEARYVARHAHNSSSSKVYAATTSPAIREENLEAAATINDLLGEFTAAYQSHTSQLSKDLGEKKKPAGSEAERLRGQAVKVYASLVLLRVESSDTAQLSVLTGIDAVQTDIAIVNDVLGKAPLSASDVSQLTKLVSVGILSKTELNKLLSETTSNRQFQTKLHELVNADKLPSDLIYSLDQDLVKQLAPDSLARFEAVTQFEQMQRVSAAIQSSRPTPKQQQAIQEYLSKYKAGQAVPTNDIRPFVAPVVYGMALSGYLQTNLGSLNDVQMSSDDQALFDSWKGNLNANQQNLGELYQKLMTAAANQPNLHARIIERVEQELVSAQQADVSHLVMPPGWGADNLPELTQQMSVELAQAEFIASSPDPNQQLARLTSTQAALQAALNNVTQINTNLITKLETRVNNFTGATEETTVLQETLRVLKETQTATVSELQTQLDTISEARTTLETAIETVRTKQLTNITELQLQAASDTEELSEQLRAQLTTQLTNIKTQSQTLVAELQTHIDGLGDSQSELRNELTASIQGIKINQEEFNSYVEAQIDSGKAATDQLQTTVQSVQTSLTAQQAEITNAAADTDSLTNLINEVKTTSETQSNQLQSQINNLTINQQDVQTSIDALASQQASELVQLTSQVSRLSVLQTEAQVAIEDLAAQQTATQSSVDQLANSFTNIQSALTTTQQVYATLQTDLAAQQSELISWQTQTSGAFDQLTQAQTQLSSQIDALASNTATLTQTVGAIEADGDATQAQLDELLATAPWAAIPEGTYVDQAQFDALKADLDAQFAQKAAELDAKFKAYQEQLNAQVQQLQDSDSTAAAERQQLQQTIGELQAQLDALQTQLDTATSTSEPEPALEPDPAL